VQRSACSPSPIDPQPLEVSVLQMNVHIIEPKGAAYLSGAATNAAVWANGKSFRSSMRAAWEVVSTAWRLWLLGAGTFAYSWLLIRRKGNLDKRNSVSSTLIPENARERRSFQQHAARE
jgi:glycogen synthase